MARRVKPNEPRTSHRLGCRTGVTARRLPKKQALRIYAVAAARETVLVDAPILHSIPNRPLGKPRLMEYRQLHGGNSVTIRVILQRYVSLIV